MLRSRRAAVRRLASVAGGFLVGRALSAGDQFASDRPDKIDPVSFDSARSMRYLEAVCGIGPRISGSDGMKKQQDLLQTHFEVHGAVIDWQRFPARQKSRPDPVEMVNLIARWHPERLRRVILASHYDTRPIADREPNPRRWHDPFVSANDGGSGVALLMEFAHHVKELKTTLGIDFVFFDGEEFIFDRERDEYFLGSKHFAAQYRKTRKPPTYIAAFVLDMIGGKNARFPVEQHSWFQAAPLVMDLWKTAEELKCTAFEKRDGPSIQDDHIALNRAGIPAVDIIDFSYPHWHRLSDVPANCSSDGMEQVARVLSVWLQKTK
jgi:hypothetical protein